MQVKLSQAVNMFFTNSSLEMVYFEAVANALDAEATEININIQMETESNLSSLVISIEDNGIGFTEERYKKFVKLFNVDEDSHKGLGRLVYKFYFNNVEVISYFNKTQKREFSFNEEMDENDKNITTIKEKPSGTKLILKNYKLQKIAKTNYINVRYIKSRLLEEFYSILFQKKKSNQTVIINLELNIGTSNDKYTITKDDILDLKEVELDFHVDLINKLKLNYHIQKTESNEKSLISAISIDNRTVQYEIIAEENIPIGYKMVFLLFSDYFTGKVDLTRQNINIPKDDLDKMFGRKG